MFVGFILVALATSLLFSSVFTLDWPSCIQLALSLMGLVFLGFAIEAGDSEPQKVKGITVLVNDILWGPALSTTARFSCSRFYIGLIMLAVAAILQQACAPA